MYSSDFLEEIYGYCKSEFDYFVTFQNMILEIFDATHSILSKHRINYYAAYGTLLGVYRDSGMIPWDHDFDIMISIDDAQNVQQILEDELPKEYYVVSNYSSNDFPYYQMRVSKKGYDHRLHVDIFYFFGLPENEEEIITIKAKTISLVKTRMQRLLKPLNTSSIKRNTYYNAMWLLNKVIHPFQYRSRLDRKIRLLLNKYPVSHSNKVAAFCEAFTVIEKSDLGNPMEIVFGKHRILVPEKPENVLNCYYKNYREYPSLDSRILEYRQGLEQIKDIDHRKKAKIDNYRNEL